VSERDYLRHDFEGRDRRSQFWLTHGATKAIVIGLAAIHVAMAFLKLAAPEKWLEVYLALSLQPDRVLDDGHVWQLLTGPLLHGRVLHLLVNLMSFWFFGRMVEERLGTKRYLQFCALAALTASLAYLAWAVFRGDIVAMVGASGAAMGLLVLAAFWYPTTTILLFFILPLPLWVAAVLLVLLDLVMAFEATGDVANTAHLGGALFGFLYHRYGASFGKVLSLFDRFSESRQRQKVRKRAREEADLRREVDRILDKVNREGMAALSEKERSFLKRASGRLRR
jgi:membrane associated rhomboid family serine protease